MLAGYFSTPVPNVLVSSEIKALRQTGALLSTQLGLSQTIGGNLLHGICYDAQLEVSLGLVLLLNERG